MKKHFKNSIVAFIVLSVFLHIVFVTSMHFLGQEDKQKEVVEIEFIQAPKESRDNRKIVEQQKQINEEIPEETKHLSKFNQTVKMQTRAESQGDFNNSAGFGNDMKKPNKVNTQKKKTKITKNGLPRLKDLAPKYDFSENAAGKISTTDDYLKDIDAGRQTLLSTREFKYYSYYERIKRKLRRHWGSKVREKVSNIIRSGRNIASNRDRITKVIITLNEIGTLVRVQVLDQSGVIDLDEAAVEAFQEAAPFPNPPRGMIDTSGHVTIHWDFILEA